MSERVEIINCISQNKVRFLIFLYFYINIDIEVYFSELRNKFKINNATLHRHLSALEHVGVLETRQGKQYNKKYYSLNRETLKLIYPQDANLDKKGVISALYTLVEQGLKVFSPIIKDFIKQDLSAAEMDVISAQLKESLFTFQINSDEINEADQVIQEFRRKMETIEQKSAGKKKDVLITTALLPIEDMLEMIFHTNEDD